MRVLKRGLHCPSKALEAGRSETWGANLVRRGPSEEKTITNYIVAVRVDSGAPNIFPKEALLSATISLSNVAVPSDINAAAVIGREAAESVADVMRDSATLNAE